MRWCGYLPLFAVLGLPGCALTPEPGVYELPADTGWARLQQADAGGFAQSRDCGPPLDISAERNGMRMIWTIRAESSTLVTFAVRLQPLDRGRIRAVVDLPLDAGNRKALVTPTGAPALRQPLQGAVIELIDAALQQRGFDAGRVGDPRTREEACGVTPYSAQKAAVNPWSNQAVADGPSAFGAPMLSGGPGLPQGPRRSGALEDMPMDLPKPGPG